MLSWLSVARKQIFLIDSKPQHFTEWREGRRSIRRAVKPEQDNIQPRRIEQSCPALASSGPITHSCLH